MTYGCRVDGGARGRNPRLRWVSAAHLGWTTPPHLGLPLQPGVPSVLEQGPKRSSCAAGRVQLVRPCPCAPRPHPSTPAYVSPHPMRGLPNHPSQRCLTLTPRGPALLLASCAPACTPASRSLLTLTSCLPNLLRWVPVSVTGFWEGWDSLRVSGSWRHPPQSHGWAWAEPATSLQGL